MDNPKEYEKGQDRRLVRVWNVNTTDGKTVRVATIEQGPRKPSKLCENCYSLCCRGGIRPVLKSEEFLSKKFPTMFMPVPAWLAKKVPRAQKLAVLAFTKNTYCNYFDPGALKCTLWPNCPKSCLAYDCREDTRKKFREFARKRVEEWLAP